MSQINIYLLIGMIFRVTGLIICIFGVLPIMYREAKVKDSLRFIRIGIFYSSLFYLFSQMSIVFMNLSRLFDWFSGSDIFDVISVFSGASNAVIAIAFYLIYHKDYKD